MKLLGKLFVFILIIVVLIFTRIYFVKIDADNYINKDLIYETFGNWNYSLLKRISSSELASISDNSVEETFNILQNNLGKMLSHEEPIVNVGYSLQFGEKYTGPTAALTYKAKYQHSEVQVNVYLIKQSGAWVIEAFNVNSPTL